MRPYAEPMPEDPTRIRVSPTLVIPASELSWRFSRSGGPGGQHANTSDTKVEVRFDIAGSPSLGPRQRARLQERLGDEVRVVAADERSQARNRELAARTVVRATGGSAARGRRPGARPSRPPRASDGGSRPSDARRVARPIVAVLTRSDRSALFRGQLAQ